MESCNAASSDSAITLIYSTKETSVETHELGQSYLGFLREETFTPLGFTLKRDNLKVVCDTHTGGTVRGLEAMLSQSMQEITWAQGYLMARGASGCGDAGHEEACKYADKHLKKVRKAMGFRVP
jgi:hypothetical protein